jgi:hypothetical protein
VFSDLYIFYKTFTVNKFFVDINSVIVICIDNSLNGSSVWCAWSYGVDGSVDASIFWGIQIRRQSAVRV